MKKTRFNSFLCAPSPPVHRSARCGGRKISDRVPRLSRTPLKIYRERKPVGTPNMKHEARSTKNEAREPRWARCVTCSAVMKALQGHYCREVDVQLLNGAKVFYAKARYPQVSFLNEYERIPPFLKKIMGNYEKSLCRTPQIGDSRRHVPQSPSESPHHDSQSFVIRVRCWCWLNAIYTLSRLLAVFQEVMWGWSGHSCIAPAFTG